MELHVTYDMRAPAFGADPNDLYDAMLDQVAWADELGFDAIGIGEHHCSEDGYNPSSLVLASAMAARTKQIQIRLSVLLAPLYDLPKLAEDAAVAQTISRGRLVLGIGAGYRAPEFETFGRKLEDRWQAMGDAIAFLRLAFTGEEFEWQGRRCRITPRPAPFAPPIVLGGSSAAAARRAARIADGWFPPLEPRLWPPYRSECIALGKPDPGEYRTHAPIFLWISNEPDKTWDVVMPHVLHQLDSYSRWTTEAMGKPAGPYAGGMTAEHVKQSPSYKVLTPEQTLELAAEIGDHSVFYLNPLLSGIAPAESWKMLRLYEERVHPHIRKRAAG